MTEMKPENEMQEDSLDNGKQPSVPNKSDEDLVPRWAALIGMVAIGLLYAALPQNLILGPSWLLLVIEAIFIIPIMLSIVTERGLSHTGKRKVALMLLGIDTLALAIAIVLFVVTLPADKHATNLLRSAALLWCFNILLFALWYWELDGGGPWNRHLSGHQAADFMFPQQVNGNSWTPHFFDYLFLAFTGATAFSPADTVPLTRPAKALMMLEAVLSFTIIGILAARAVNILGS